MRESPLETHQRSQKTRPQKPKNKKPKPQNTQSPKKESKQESKPNFSDEWPAGRLKDDSPENLGLGFWGVHFRGIGCFFLFCLSLFVFDCFRLFLVDSVCVSIVLVFVGLSWWGFPPFWGSFGLFYCFGLSLLFGVHFRCLSLVFRVLRSVLVGFPLV